MPGLNSAAMGVAATALKGAMLYAQLHSGPAGNGTANIAATTRQSVTWGTVTGTGNFGISSSLNFTGGTPGGPVYSVTLWSASTSGTCYGEFIITGDATLDGSGNYVLSALDLVGGNAGTTTTPAVVGYDSTGTGAHAHASSWSYSHTIGATANALVVMISTWSDPEPTITATCDGVAMTLIGAKFNYYYGSGGYGAVRLFGLLNPPTGTKTIALSATSGAYAGVNSVAYTNVTSFGNAVTTSGSTEVPTVTVPTGPGQMVVGGFGGWNGSAFTTPSGTTRFNVPYTFGVEFAHLYQDTAALDRKTETTLTTAAGVSHWGAVGIPLIP